MWTDVITDGVDGTARGIAWSISSAIDSGQLSVGDRLPPIRQAAEEYQVAPATISAAWAQLVRAGLIETRGRQGSFVREAGVGPRRYRQALTTSPGSAIDLSTGLPDATLLPDVEAALHRISVTAPRSYLADPVLPELREHVARSWPYDAEQFTIVDGAMDGINQIVATHLRFGDRVAIEQPTFPPLLDLLEANGIDCIGVTYDDQGPSADELRLAVDAGAKAFIFQPWGHNPTGQSLTADRARQLAAVVSDCDLLVIEDDAAAGSFAGSAVSVGEFVPSRTITVRSFSKSHGPDLRLAAIGGPRSLVDPLIERRFLGQGWSSRILQTILLDLATDPATVDAVADAQATSARRTNALADALSEAGVTVPGRDGINLWVPVANESAALLHLVSSGVRAAAGSPFWLSPPAQEHIRITTSTVQDGYADLAEVIATASQLGAWGGQA